MCGKREEEEQQKNKKWQALGQESKRNVKVKTACHF